MENTNKIKDALVLSESSSEHLGLTRVLSGFQNKTVEDILNAEKDKEVRKIDNEIRELIHRLVYNNSGDVTELSKAIFTLKNHLLRGVNDLNIKDVLIFLSVNCYLKIELNDFFDSISIKGKDILSEQLAELVLKVDTKASAPPNTPHHERKLLKKYTSGYENINIEDTYSLIQAMERGGRGFHFNFLFEDLLKFIYHFNYSTYIIILNNLSTPQEFVFYFQSLPVQSLQKIIHELNLKNQWLNFELIRQIVEKEKDFSDTDLESVSDGVENGLIKIKASDISFFKQTIKFFFRSKVFMMGLGKSLTSFEDAEVACIVKDDFIINSYSSNKECLNSFFNCFEAKVSSNRSDHLTKVLFEKWSLFFDDTFNSKGKYQNDLLLTDYCESVVHYYNNLFSEEELISLIKNKFQQIKYFDSEWSDTESIQVTKFHLHITKLYLLSYSYLFRQIKHQELSDLFDDFKSNDLRLHKHTRHEEVSYLSVLEENFA